MTDKAEMTELHAGLTNEITLTVTDQDTAKVYRSGELVVFATPAMIALMEETCLKSVAPCLEEGQGTVGTMINVAHTAATPVGMKVTCRSRLLQVDGRRLVFSVEASDEKGSIGKGTHERFIIKNDKFMAKTQAKLTGAE